MSNIFFAVTATGVGPDPTAPILDIGTEHLGVLGHGLGEEPEVPAE